MQQGEEHKLSFIIAEIPGRNVLLAGAEKACNSLACRSDISIPSTDICCVSPALADIQATMKDKPPGSMVILGVGASADISHVCAICESIDQIRSKVVIAEQSVGSPPLVLSAGQILSLVYRGAKAVFREYDFIAEETVLNLLLQYSKRSNTKAVLLGEPAIRVKNLLDEVKLDWNDPDSGVISRPEISFRLACALTVVPSLDTSLDNREKIARELNSKGLFPYNFEDTRKAVGVLTRRWDLHTKNPRRIHKLPEEARRRGFPHPQDADTIFDYLDNIDTEDETYTSASGDRFNILRIIEL